MSKRSTVCFKLTTKVVEYSENTGFRHVYAVTFSVIQALINNVYVFAHYYFFTNTLDFSLL